MAEPILFVPGYGVSPRCCEDVPALRALLDCFREVFEVTTFHWPTVKGGPSVPLTWQAVGIVLYEALPAGGHLVAAGGNVTHALKPISDGPIELRSIVADGFDIPVATLDALGMYGLARAAEAAIRIDQSPYQSSLVWVQGADEETTTKITERMYADCDWELSGEFARQSQTLNLVEEAPQVATPTLFVDSALAYPGWSDRDVFARFFPNVEFADMPSWRLDAEASGRAFAELAIPFMQKHSARTILATVLFADIVDSTVQATTLGDRRWSRVLGHFHALAGRELKRSRGTLVDTAGDGFLAVFDDPAAAIECASSVASATGELGLEIRAGVHTGQAEVSGEKYSGVAVHTAARVCAKAAPGEVLITDTVRQLLAGSALTFEDRGIHDLKGLPAPVPLYAAAIRRT
jgi:class 3 adenylate cyclase